MKSIVILLLFTPLLGFAQRTEDSKVIVTVNDTANLYRNVKTALVKNDFIVKDDGNKFILTTYAAELHGIPGYSIIRAEINDNAITLTGVYGLIKVNDWGYTQTPRNYKRIIYFKGSKSWKVLQSIADNIQNKENITYSN